MIAPLDPLRVTANAQLADTSHRGAISPPTSEKRPRRHSYEHRQTIVRANTRSERRNDRNFVNPPSRSPKIDYGTLVLEVLGGDNRFECLAHLKDPPARPPGIWTLSLRPPMELQQHLYPIYQKTRPNGQSLLFGSAAPAFTAFRMQRALFDSFGSSRPHHSLFRSRRTRDFGGNKFCKNP